VAQTKSTSPSFQSGTPQRGELGTNHWIPFTENEVNAPERFESRFMTEFIGGKLGRKEIPLVEGWQSQTDGVDITEQTKSTSPAKAGTPQEENIDGTTELFASTQESFVPTEPLEFSPQAQAVFEAGRELWKYYFEKIGNTKSSSSNTFRPTDTFEREGQGISKTPSLYDIKAYFQGQSEDGRMNNKSDDEKYNLLIANLRDSLEVLSLKIQPKVYEYGFLRG